jgi:hypothetical protein
MRSVPAQKAADRRRGAGGSAPAGGAAGPKAGTRARRRAQRGGTAAGAIDAAAGSAERSEGRRRSREAGQRQRLVEARCRDARFLQNCAGKVDPSIGRRGDLEAYVRTCTTRGVAPTVRTIRHTLARAPSCARSPRGRHLRGRLDVRCSASGRRSRGAVEKGTSAAFLFAVVLRTSGRVWPGWSSLPAVSRWQVDSRRAGLLLAFEQDLERQRGQGRGKAAAGSRACLREARGSGIRLLASSGRVQLAAAIASAVVYPLLLVAAS